MSLDLDHLPWTNYRHFGGGAEDLPALIRALVVPNEQKQALSTLRAVLNENGFICEATPHVVPFLLELIAPGAPADRAELLVLLRELFTSRSRSETSQGYDAQTEEIKSQLARERRWIQETQKAVRNGLERYLALLDDPDPAVKLAVSYLLIHFRDHYGRVVPRLQAIVENTAASETVRAGVSYCLGHPAEKNPELRNYLRQVCSAPEPLSIRVAAAIYVIRYEPKNPMPEAVDALKEALTDGSKVTEIFSVFPWPHNDPVGHAICTLAFLGPAAQTFLPAMGQALANSQRPDSTATVVESLLWLALEGEPFPATATLADLSADQKSALQGVAESDAYWEPNGIPNAGVSPQLTGWNLPGTRGAFRAFLAGELTPGSPGWGDPEPRDANDESFLRAIAEQPTNLDTQVEYAEWLAKRDQQRSNLLRVWAEFMRTPLDAESAPRLVELRTRYRSLLLAVADAGQIPWLQAVDRARKWVSHEVAEKFVRVIMYRLYGAEIARTWPLRVKPAMLDKRLTVEPTEPLPPQPGTKLTPLNFFVEPGTGDVSDVCSSG